MPYANRCPAKARTTGNQCGRPAGWGTDHNGIGNCRYHGGNTRNHIRHAEKVQAAQEQERLNESARRLLAALDVTPIGDPLTELATLAGQVVAFKNELAGLVNELTAEPVQCPHCHGETGLGVLRYRDARGAEQLRSEVALFERALDRCNTVLGTMAKLNIDERLARISERQAEAVIGAIDAALDAVDVPRERRSDAKRAVATHLRLVKTG